MGRGASRYAPSETRALPLPLQQRGLEAHRRLLVFYGEPSPERKQADPLAELVQTILSQNTSDVNSERAYASLWAAFGSWDRIADAREEEIVGAIRLGGLAQMKAPRIRLVLQGIRADRGSIELDFLRSMDTEAARSYLTSLPGVGPKTAACVLLFSLDKPAIPVDTHVHRVAKRLGLIGPRVSAEQAEGVLEELVPPKEDYSFHMSLIRHGRQVCRAQRPLCESCPLGDICPRVGVGASA